MSDPNPYGGLNRPERLTTIHRSGIRDAEVQPTLERAVRLATKLLDVPAAQVNLVLADRQVTRAAAGPRGGKAGQEAPLSESYCQLIVRTREPLVIPDAARDARVAENPTTARIGIGAYLGVPIAVAGEVLATLCVFTPEPRTWTAEETALLADVSALAAADLECRLQTTLHDEVEQEHEVLIEALATERARLEAVLNNVPVGVVLAEAPSGRIVLGNPYIEEIFRHPVLYSDDVEAYRDWIAFHADGRQVQGHEYPLARALTTGKPASGEYLYQRGDGTRIWIRIIGAPIRSTDGAITGGVVAILDIDAQKRAEAERERLLRQLQAEQTRLQQVFSAAPAVMALYSGPDHIVTLVNPTWEQTVGKPDALGRSFRAVFPEFAGTGLFELLDQVYQSGEPYIDAEITVPLERWGRLENTSWSFVWLPLAPREDGERDVLVHAVEVTQQVRARESLRGLADAALAVNSAASLNEALQTITDQARRVIGAHQAVTSMTVSDDLAQAINAVSLSDKYDAWRGYNVPPNGQGIYAVVCETNQPMRMTQAELEAHPRWRNFSGEARDHPPMRGWLAVPLIGRDGRNIGVIQLSDKEQGEFSVQDEVVLTQFAQTAAAAIENARLYQEALEANRAKSDFLATMSHELRTPLNAMIGYTQLLELGLSGELPPAARQQVERIGLAARHLLQIIEEILTFSRMEAGRETVEPTAVDLAELVREVNAIIEPLAEAEQLHFQTRVERVPATLRTDARKLRQILVNLLGNAVKFTEQGEVELRVTTEGERIHFVVRDTGIGIAAEHLDQLWEPFWQADATTRRTVEGTGLGLAVSRRLAQLLGGDIHVRSEPSKGTVFTVHLPLAGPPEQPGGGAPA